MRKKIEHKWQKLDEDTSRLAVYGGWVLLIQNRKGITSKFITDNDHLWHPILPELKTEE